MDLLGTLLNPGAYGASGQASGNLSAQSQKQAQEIATLLQTEGQGKGKQPFYSPWQVGGQLAQALAGKLKQGQANQGYSTLNTMEAPGQGAAPGAAPATPPATPQATPQSNLPWSGATAGDDGGEYAAA